MDTIITVATSLFWFVVVISVLVFVHEGGHFLAARACGVRVTEFFLGMPCRINLHRVSRRIGTKFGVTPLLIGGYAMICGMEPFDDELGPQALALIHERGRVSVDDLARELDVDEERALSLCVSLLGWGSVAPYYDPEKGEKPDGRFYATTYESMPRDAAGLTVYDGRRFDRANATDQGEPWVPAMGADAFFKSERSRTYVGKGFWKRAFMLVAGIAVNIVVGFLLMMSVFSVIGYDVSYDVNQIGGVTQGSVADELGIEAGDRITSIAGVETDTWTDILTQIDAVEGTGSFEITYERDGSAHAAETSLDEGEPFGISILQERIRLNPLDSARVTAATIGATAQAIARLLVPSHTMEVLSTSSSVVGIAVMSGQAAAAGASTFLNFAAALSFSLGFMNLLPIPPLDGGKLLIEIIQAVIRRPVSMKVQNALSYVGVGLLMLLFVYMLRQDVLRFFF